MVAVQLAVREQLTAQKPTVIAVLTRFAGMRANVGKVPIACAVLDAMRGPGRCFSCGDALEHAEAYGRCVPCGIASELFYVGGQGHHE